MIIKNKGYASFLVLVHGYNYTIKNNDINIDILFETHEKLNADYRKSIHSKFFKLNMKFLSILSNN